MIIVVKVKIFDDTKSIAQIADEPGFKYSSHFTRMFKQKTGTTPLEYRNMN